ncbi:nucleobindin-2-like isoform X3 [Pollicipes pollicipes]|uniref:nucleobindin-2-like isoform X3 n=1 Tax=Pollicipes pollicipes TaxID=41117 RepID=UPI001884CB99|nr:nucleobindin-2-like isoform X3 [Pollicipes pollicipes]
MAPLLKLVCYMALVAVAVAPPPHRQPQPPPVAEEDININSETMGLEYKNYLEEIVKLLEQDSKFKTILQNATDEDIKSGQVAEQLHVVDPAIRSKLDELKRIELGRLRQKATEAFELSNGLDRNTIKEPHHLDHRNPHTFREEDLRRLIHKTTKDLEDLDRQRKEDFQKYEMEKEFKYQEELKAMDAEHRKEAEKKHEEEQKKKKEHPKSQVHHPLSEDQLEEVWQEQDHMEKEDFDPETFFRMHDLDGNEVLDQMEVMALFKRELDKLYNGTDYDPREREEEMNEMRESTYAEVDTDKDGFISLKEFMASTQHDDYRADQGWEGVNEREVYARQQYEAYERQRMAEIQRQINMGMPHAPIESLQQQQQHPAIAQQQQQQQISGQQYQQPQQIPIQQQVPVQQQQFQPPPMLQQQQFQPPPMQQQQFQQIPVQQQQIPVQQQQIPVQQQIPIQQQQIPVQQQQIPVQQQGQIPAQKQQQQAGSLNQVPVQTKQ